MKVKNNLHWTKTMAPLGSPTFISERGEGPVHLKFKLPQQKLIQNQDPWDKPNRSH